MNGKYVDTFKIKETSKVEIDLYSSTSKLNGVDES